MDAAVDVDVAVDVTADMAVDVAVDVVVDVTVAEGASSSPSRLRLKTVYIYPASSSSPDKKLIILLYHIT